MQEKAEFVDRVTPNAKRRPHARTQGKPVPDPVRLDGTVICGLCRLRLTSDLARHGADADPSSVAPSRRAGPVCASLRKDVRARRPFVQEVADGLVQAGKVVFEAKTGLYYAEPPPVVPTGLDDE